MQGRQVETISDIVYFYWYRLWIHLPALHLSSDTLFVGYRFENALLAKRL